jgi:hypothetical protein
MKPIHFEVATYVISAIVIVLLATVCRNRREYWYAYIGCSLMFPFEWIADRYWMFLDYDWGFVMFPVLFERLPIIMPLSWGWFFGVPLILCIRFRDKIDAMPLIVRILVLYVIFFGWDFALEFSSTGYGLWDYHWHKEAMIGGILPWFIPFAVSFNNTLLYFVHNRALKKSETQAWIPGFVTHVLAYLAVFVINVAIGWPIIKLFGIVPVFGQ